MGLGLILVVIGVLLLIAVGVVVFLVVMGNRRAENEAKLQVPAAQVQEHFAPDGPGQFAYQAGGEHPQQGAFVPNPQPVQGEVGAAPAAPQYAQQQIFTEQQPVAVPESGYQSVSPAPEQFGMAEQITAEYERLAAEPVPQRWSSLAGEEKQLYAWPDDYSQQGQYVDESPNPQGYPAAFVADVDSAAPVTPAVPVAPAVPVEPYSQAQDMVAPVSSVQEADGVQEQPVSAVAVSYSDATAQAVIEDDEDRTVVVQRRARFGIELPDGTVLELPSDDVVVGRKPQEREGSTVLLINDMTRTLSKSHLRLRRTGDDWTVEDLHSTNGVSIVAADGSFVLIEPGKAVPVTPQMVFGTLEVTLRQL